jgi:hypothetical protein
MTTPGGTRRLTSFDIAIGVFVLVLIPIAYGTYRLFRTPQAEITSVRAVPITKEERRVGGPALTAKLKVQGSGLRPLLRATIDDTPALGFVFENPKSADVLVGAVPAGSHDLVLYDGVQEVARARRAVTTQATEAVRLRLVGTLVSLDRATADALKTGASYPAPGPAAATIVQLGAVQPDRRRLAVGDSEIDLTVAGSWARETVVSVPCDAETSIDNCSVGGRALASIPPPTVLIAGPVPLNLAVREVLPDSAAQAASVRVKFDASRDIIGKMKAGDRDALLDERAAVVVVAGLDATLRLGADAAADGLRYRGRDLRPGAPFTLTTAGYIATGTIVDVSTGATK